MQIFKKSSQFLSNPEILKSPTHSSIDSKETTRHHPLEDLLVGIFEYSQDPEQKIVDLFHKFSDVGLFDKLVLILDETSKRRPFGKHTSDFLGFYTEFKEFYRKKNELKIWDPALVNEGKNRHLCRKFINFIKNHPAWLAKAPKEDVETHFGLLFNSLKEFKEKGDKSKVKYIEKALTKVGAHFYQRNDLENLSFFYRLAENFKDEELLSCVFDIKSAIKAAPLFQEKVVPFIRAKAFATHLAVYANWFTLANPEELAKELENLIEQSMLVEKKDLELIIDSCISNQHCSEFLGKLALKNLKIFEELSDKIVLDFFTAVEIHSTQNSSKESINLDFEKLNSLVKYSSLKFFENHLETRDCVQIWSRSP